jgi:16S rRNA (uracil1498-N3)-methyltransferase
MSQADGLKRFFTPGPLSVGQLVTLPSEQSSHMVAVLRIGAGQRVRLFTGEGDEFIAIVVDANPAGVRARIAEECPPSPSVSARLTVAFALPPGQRADVLIEKGTELGASAFRPLLCERVQGYQAAAAVRRADRWRRKAADAARQCGRAAVPELLPPMRIEQFVCDCTDELRLIASRDAPQTLWTALKALGNAAPRSACMAVGPAGGLTSHETGAALSAQFRPVSLGPHTLRVETAAICLLAGVVLWLEGVNARQGGGAP